MTTLWTEYDPAFFGKATFYSIGCDKDGKPNPGETPSYAYESQTDSPTKAQLAWGASVEYRTIERGSDGRDWAVSKAYGNRSLDLTWPVETVRAEMADVATGQFWDLTNILPAGPSGAPFCPNIVPDSGEIMFRTWGWIWTDAKQTGTPRRDHTFFYQANLQYGQTVANPSWTGEGSNSVLAVIMREAWWDKASGWARGSGTADPWNGDVVADPGVVSYTGWQAWGRGRGVLWAYRYSDYNTALAYVTKAGAPPSGGSMITDEQGWQWIASKVQPYLTGTGTPPGPTGPTAPPTGPTGPTAPPGPTAPTGPTGPTEPPAGALTPGPDGIYEIPWESTTSATRHKVPLRCQETGIIRFTTGGATPRNGTINMAEYLDARQQRLATISTTPGDLSGNLGDLHYKTGSSVNWNYCVGGPQQQWALLLAQNTTYYINVKTTSGTPGQSAMMFLDLYVPA